MNNYIHTLPPVKKISGVVPHFMPINCHIRSFLSLGVRHILSYISGIISLTFLLAATDAQAPHKGDQAHQAVGVKNGLPTGDFYERVRRDIVGPGGGKLPQALLVIDEVEAVLVPNVPMFDHLELPPGKRMEGVSHPEGADFLPPIGCTRADT